MNTATITTKPEKPIIYQLETHGVIATIDGSVKGYGRTLADAVTDLMAKLGLWVKGF